MLRMLGIKDTKSGLPFFPDGKIPVGLHAFLTLAAGNHPAGELPYYSTI